ncbi:MAG: hypothetical protein IID18_10705 [Nitrospinae bacterium]|nr:hypothetical protein [Nitrospinota bacterium]
MIPFRYLPQGAVFQLRGKNGSPLEQYDGSGVMVHGKDGIDFLVLRDRDGKKIKPVAISQDEIKANGRLMTSVKSGSCSFSFWWR